MAIVIVGLILSVIELYWMVNGLRKVARNGVEYRRLEIEAAERRLVRDRLVGKLLNAMVDEIDAIGRKIEKGGEA